MAYTQCERHGGKVAMLICPHLRDCVLNHRPSQRVIRLQADYLGEPGWVTHVCVDCAADRGFHESMTVTGDDGLDLVFGYYQKPMCPDCFETWRKG